MELYGNKDFFVIRNGENELWCSRNDGALTPQRATGQLSSGYECLGIIHGVIGKLKISHDSDWKLLLVKTRVLVGTLPRGQMVYRIAKVLVVTLGPCSTKDLDVEPCPDHHPFKVDQRTNGLGMQKKPLQRTWNQFKQAAENIKPKKVPKETKETKEMKEKEKYEKKVLEELIKMFNDSESFYYCPYGDITNCIQRQQSLDPLTPIWQSADDRFFWNKYMLQDLISSKSELCHSWLVPIIQGYVQIESCQISFDDEFETNLLPKNSQSDLRNLKFRLFLISRRSRHRAGTRFKRRGVDEDGNTANYVETEQILEFRNHFVSFVQVRGSVPLFWHQTGIKYKPPPKLYRDNEQNHTAFCHHFEEQLEIYKMVASVNLVNQLGTEKVIGESFLRHVVMYNNPLMTYVAFDFHEYCRGMRFENVGILTENIMDVIQSMGYCWVDKSGLICEQKGVFRVNCIDCLDRTNVIQSALARIVLEIQCRKLGLLSPECPLTPNYRTVYQKMWANNGDVISCQYAGTAALKSDYTRTGEIRLAGVMKDGVKSANRYYINRVKDVYRQAVVDLMLGNPVVEEFDHLDSAEEPEILVEKEENLKTLIDDCKKMLLQDPVDCLGGWGLINCDDIGADLDPSQQDMDIILLLTQNAYYVAHYDDDIDQVTSYEMIALDDLDRIEIGLMNLDMKHHPMCCLRIFYRHQADAGYFHTFCMTTTRLFNNMVVRIGGQDEARESLRAISETIRAAKKLIGQGLAIMEKDLDRQKPRRQHINTISIANEAQARVESSIQAKVNMSRNCTSENPASAHEKNMAKLVHLTENQSTKSLTLGRTMAGMLSVRKMQFDPLQPERFQMFPAVGYQKGVVTKDPKAEIVALGKDEVGGAVEKSVTEVLVPSEYGNGKESPGDEKKNLQIDYNLPGSSFGGLKFSELDLSSQGHVVLPSVGLLMANPLRIIHALLSHPIVAADRGHADLHEDGLDGGNADILLEQKEAFHVGQVELRSSDIDERGSRTKSSDENSKAEVDVELIRKNVITKDFDVKRYGVRLPKTTEISAHDPADGQVGKVRYDNDGTDGFPLIIIDDPDTQQPQPLLRCHSLVKFSYSEGSLSNPFDTSNNENVMIDLDDLDLFDSSRGQSGSALNKLRFKMVNMALPAMAMPENRQRQLKEQARNNRLRSQLRFKELKTRIILL